MPTGLPWTSTIAASRPHRGRTIPAEVCPFLMFSGRCEAAMTLYVARIPSSRILGIRRYGPGEAGPESVMVASFALGDLTAMCSESPVQHAFDFTPSSSLLVTCESCEQLDELAEKLSGDGKVPMPLDNYGFSQRFAWVQDRFQVSWQLNLD